MSKLKRAVWVLVIIITCVGCDHITKGLARAYLSPTTVLSLANDTVRVQYVVNRGAVFSFEDLLPAGWQGTPCTVAVASFLGGLLLYLWFAPAVRTTSMVALSLFCGGLLSNLLDRVVLGGSAIDFLNIGWGPFRTDIFNVADIAVVTGGLLFVCSVIRRPRPSP